MATPIEMPKLGNAIEECLLARWYKRPGEPVTAGEVLADIETDKSNFELTAPVDGTLLAVFCQDGDIVPVCTNIAVIGAPGEPIGELAPGRKGESSPEATDEVSAATDPAAVAEVPPQATVLTESSGPTAAMSPRARRFAREHDFYPRDVRGSGPGGRVLEADLRELLGRVPRPAPVPPAEARPRAAATKGSRVIDPAATPVALSRLRGTIARRMRQSLSSTAQYTLNTTAAATGLLALRARLKTAGSPEDASNVNINAMVLFCAIKALEAVPELNVEFLDDTIYQHAGVHIGFACDTPRGLVVPVVRDSQRLTLSQLAARAKGLTTQALDGSISPDDLAGGTFTVSNLGPYGIESFTPILNPPQVAILGVNAIQLKPVHRGDGVAFVDHIGFSLTCDHQVVDGAPGARFLQKLREFVERVERLA